MQTEIDLDCFDGTYTFRLGPKQIREIQNKCDAGIGKIYSRTIAGRYGFGDGDFHPDKMEFVFDDLIEIVRQGLIGGKHGVVDGEDILVTAPRTKELIENYLLDGPDRMVMVQIWAFAAKVLDTLMFGFVPPKKV